MYGKSDGKQSKAVDYKGTHEVDVSVGLPTAWVVSPMIDMGLLLATFFNPDPVEPSGNYKVVPNLRAEYGYNVLSWLNVGVAVNYSSCTSPMNYQEDGPVMPGRKVLSIDDYSQVNLLAHCEWVRMYSAVGAGIGIVRTTVPL